MVINKMTLNAINDKKFIFFIFNSPLV